MDAQTITVDLGERSHPIVVGSGLIDRLHELVAWPEGAARVVVVTNAEVKALYWGRAADAIRRAGLEPTPITVPDGEQAKSAETLHALWNRFAALPLRRSDVVMALGGGVVGDLAGFAAATWNRGVDLVQVPTTLLAQVDSAIGGKTGINLAQGKNLVGAFHQPLAVISDVSLLATLPARELRAGLGEVTKYGFIADPVVLERLESDPAAATTGDVDLMTDIVLRASAVKGEFVAADERESGRRALLNYGHTVGHAIEALTGYERYRHGEAVALGMVFAARLSEALGVAVSGLADRTVAALEGLGLPTGGIRLDPASVWDVMSRDKKAGRGGVRFVISRQPGQAEVIDEPDRALVDEILRSLA